MLRELTKNVKVMSIDTNKKAANIEISLEEAYKMARIILVEIERAKEKYKTNDLKLRIVAYANRGYIQFWARSV